MSYDLKRLARRLGAAALAAAGLCGAVACGKEGPPTPPFRALPAPTTDLAAHQRGTRVVLSFKYPQTTPGGQALNGVSKVEVWEAVVTPEPPKPAKTGKSDKDSKGSKDSKNGKDAKGATTATSGAAAAATATGSPSGSSSMSADSAGTAASGAASTSAMAGSSSPGSATGSSLSGAASTDTASTGTPTPTASATPATSATSAGSATSATSATAATPVTTPGAPDPLDTKLLTKLAKLKLTLTSKDIAAATLGSRLVVDLPLPEPLPVAPATPAAVSPTGTGSAAVTGATGAPSGTATTGTPGGATTPIPAGTTGAASTAGTSSATGTTGTTSAPGLPIHYYVVRTYGPQGDRSAFSNQAILVAKAPPGAPEGVTVAGEAEGIRVEWKPVPEAGGYAIYRRAATERLSSQPLAVVRPPDASFLDARAEFGQSYIYSVTALDPKDPLIESAVKAEQEIHYVDHFPPPVPGDLVTVAETAKVRLVWRQSEANDLAGYIVYRKAASGEFARLTAQPIGGTNYIDSTAVSGQAYDYRVSAIDKTGNESAPSAEVHVAVP